MAFCVLMVAMFSGRIKDIEQVQKLLIDAGFDHRKKIKELGLVAPTATMPAQKVGESR